MQAWQVHELGEPGEVMRLAEVARPAPGDGQVLLKVRAANINFPDALMCRGQYQVRPPLPFTPGVEICGETEDGRRVIANPALPYGGFAEYAVADAAALLPAPEALDDAEAAALHIGYQTGWFGLHRRAGLEAGETLLVHAAAGGVGSAAVQLGKAAGATVIGVAWLGSRRHPVGASRVSLILLAGAVAGVGFLAPRATVYALVLAVPVAMLLLMSMGDVVRARVLSGGVGAALCRPPDAP